MLCVGFTLAEIFTGTKGAIDTYATRLQKHLVTFSNCGPRTVTWSSCCRIKYVCHLEYHVVGASSSNGAVSCSLACSGLQNSAFNYQIQATIDVCSGQSSPVSFLPVLIDDTGNSVPIDFLLLITEEQSVPPQLEIYNEKYFVAPGETISWGATAFVPGDPLGTVTWSSVNAGLLSGLTFQQDGNSIGGAFSPAQSQLGDSNVISFNLKNDADDATIPVSFTFSVTLDSPPVCQSDSFTTSMGVPAVFNLLGNDFDPDGILDSPVVSLMSFPTDGSYVLDPDSGNFEFVPQPNFVGTTTFAYRLEDR
eukprot:scaffold12_cov337-Prasinococcus_capsulatus_cf.AAC.1